MGNELPTEQADGKILMDDNSRTTKNKISNFVKPDRSGVYFRGQIYI